MTKAYVPTQAQRRATLSLMERIAAAKVAHGAKNAREYVDGAKAAKKRLTH